MFEQNHFDPKGPPLSPLSRRIAKMRSAQHRELIRKKGHKRGSRIYSAGMTTRVPYVNTRHNPAGYFKKK